MPLHPGPRLRLLTAAIAALGVLVAGPALAEVPAAKDGSGLHLDTASSAPDLVTGGDALVEISSEHNVPHDRVEVTLNEKDVTSAFTWDGSREVLVGRVDGMVQGENLLRAALPGQARGADELTVINHPDEGPLFSGPHEQPFACETQDFEVPGTDETLGEPLDENCSIEDRVDHVYYTTAGTWEAFPEDATDYPDDLARTTTDEGIEVPFIVRLAHGTANRGIFQHAALHDPLTEDPVTPAARPAGWNGKVVYTLGGGCVDGWYRQGPKTGGVLDPRVLSKGYAMVSSSLNVFGNNCNDLLTSETAQMTKEEFIETYGRDDFTIGLGASGGSYQGHQAADNYPGIFDGIVVGASFPEVGFGTIDSITDARLLQNYFAGGTDVEWTQEQKRRVTGFQTLATMDNVSGGALRIDPREFCPPTLPQEQRYDPETNPTGVRCDVYDHTSTIYGTDPETGFALRPLDNVGIQYGLAALADGTIDAEQFLDLNDAIGGYDQDANFRPERSVADLPAVEAAYRTGRLTDGGQGLASTPVIDYRAYADEKPEGDIHIRYHTSSMRERLRDANGSIENHVSLLEDDRYGLFSTKSPLLMHALTQMDAWLTELEPSDDLQDRPTLPEIGAARPDSLVEGCMDQGDEPEFHAMALDRDPASECEQLYPSASFPREVAGESVKADVIACTTSEPVRAEYPVEFTDEQWEQLLAAFPDGVCDYTLPGRGEVEHAGTWQRF
ncbi:DUF6351 family protein [Brachybacterium tyrofermentans]|uniref:DUF6351 family protein n=1 Tax=Brachybacterium tyrofermentans TaxID=47848 RepID=UPI00299F8C3A|nr:DUF6351 family protein [Brachybacterium tyrofermentans]